MKVKELIDQLKKFPPEAAVHVGVSWPDRVTEAHENVWVGDYGGGPQINAAMDLKGVAVFVGCTLRQQLPKGPPQTLDLGRYESPELAAKVRDFYIVHKGLGETLNFPGFDYDRWIPPRTTSGDYNPHIAAILKEKLLED